MSTRKKWRLQLIPLFTYKRFESKVKTYEAVDYYRHGYAEGMSRIHHVNVQVDEGNGWVLYERIVFPPREAQLARVEALPDEWLGSVEVCNAIFEALSQHLTLPSTDGLYMWCSCEWRSDGRPGSDPGPAAVIHVTNAVHAAVTPAIQESLRSRVRAALKGGA